MIKAVQNYLYISLTVSNYIPVPWSIKEQGIYVYGADEDMSTDSIRFLEIQNNILAANVEGLSLYYSENGQGYLLASSQGQNYLFIQIPSVSKPKYASSFPKHLKSAVLFMMFWEMRLTDLFMIVCKPASMKSIGISVIVVKKLHPVFIFAM